MSAEEVHCYQMVLRTTVHAVVGRTNVFLAFRVLT